MGNPPWLKKFTYTGGIHRLYKNFNLDFFIFFNSFLSKLDPLNPNQASAFDLRLLYQDMPTFTTKMLTFQVDLKHFLGLFGS